MIHYLVGTAVVGAAGVAAYTLGEQRLRIGDLAYVPVSAIVVDGAFKPFWEGIKTGLPDDIIEIRVSWRGVSLEAKSKRALFGLLPPSDDWAKGVVVKAGGAVIDVGFALKDVVKFQRDGKTYKGGR